VAKIEPIVTENDVPHDMLQSIEQPLKKCGQHAFLAAGTPDQFLADIEALSNGDEA